VLLLLSAVAFSVVLVAVAAGCYTRPTGDFSPPPEGPAVSPHRAEPAGASVGPAKPGAAAEPSGLPCDVAKVLAASCTDCHGRPLAEGAPVALVTYEDLVAPSRSEPERSVAAVSLDRIKDTRRPMPPDEALGAADVAVFESWVGAGMPRGACGGKTAGAGGSDGADAGDDVGDGGSAGVDGGGAGVDGGGAGGAAPSPADASVAAAPACTSGVTWAPGAAASELMHPGTPCLGCHAIGGGPTLALAGTVYPSAHEPDDCNGSTGGNLHVLILDAAGKTHTMPVNAAGNFLRVTGLALPYRAMVVNGAKVRAMKTPQTEGDCNSCHSAQGAAGRILAP
jgi:cytochrome c553